MGMGTTCRRASGSGLGGGLLGYGLISGGGVVWVWVWLG